MSVIFITHDLGVVAEIADRVIIIYGGHVAEAGTAFEIFDSPKHPYTMGLMTCLPDIHSTKDRLTPIPGAIPDLIEAPPGCVFHPRCPRVMPVCHEQPPPQISVAPDHLVVCHLYGKNGPTSHV